jgi:hypothetical protein
LAAFGLVLETLHTMAGIGITVGTAATAAFAGGFAIGMALNEAVPSLGRGDIGAWAYDKTH